MADSTYSLSRSFQPFPTFNRPQENQIMAEELLAISEEIRIRHSARAPHAMEVEGGWVSEAGPALPAGLQGLVSGQPEQGDHDLWSLALNVRTLSFNPWSLLLKFYLTVGHFSVPGRFPHSRQGHRQIYHFYPICVCPIRQCEANLY